MYIINDGRFIFLFELNLAIKMNIYKTTIKCAGCLAKVKPFLDNESLIKSWEVNTEIPQKLLKIEGDISSESVQILLQKAGFSIVKD